MIGKHIKKFDTEFQKIKRLLTKKNETIYPQEIKRIVGNQKLKNQLRKLGLDQVKKYSWQKMAQQTLEVYREQMEWNRMIFLTMSKRN